MICCENVMDVTPYFYKFNVYVHILLQCCFINNKIKFYFYFKNINLFVKISREVTNISSIIRHWLIYYIFRNLKERVSFVETFERKFYFAKFQEKLVSFNKFFFQSLIKNIYWKRNCYSCSDSEIKDNPSFILELNANPLDCLLRRRYTDTHKQYKSMHA